MTRKVIIESLKYTMEKHKSDTVDTFDTDISLMCKDILDYLSAEPCDDAISRKDAVFALNDAQVEYDENYKGLGKAKEIIDNLPPIQPIRPKGKWMNVLEDIYHCNLCKKSHCFKTNFCPNCGADMRGEENAD